MDVLSITTAIKIDGISLNDCVQDNFTEYISFKDRARLLDLIRWYVKLDHKDGYRQLAVHQCFSPYIGGKIPPANFLRLFPPANF